MPSAKIYLYDIVAVLFNKVYFRKQVSTTGMQLQNNARPKILKIAAQRSDI